MMRVVSRNVNFIFCNKKDFQLKYAQYDETIKEYEKVGNNISTDLMKRFLFSAHPKISRQQNYIPKVKHLLTSIIPHFENNSDFYAQNGLLSTIIVLYNTMNIHRKLIFELVQSKTDKFENHSHQYWFQIYNSFVELHHSLNNNFKNQIKTYLTSLFFEKTSLLNQIPKFAQFQFAIKVLKTMLADQEIDVKTCQLLLRHIESKILPKLETISLTDRNIGFNLAFLNELIKLRSLKLNSQKFIRLLELSKQFQISQKMQSQKRFVKRQNFIVSLNDGDSLKIQGSNVFQNKRPVSHGQSSVFETIFSRILQEKGYDFQKNVFIGIFEYDVIIKGKKQKIYRPFDSIKKQNSKPISPEQWNVFKSMNNFKKIKVNEQFQNPAVLNLNGPYHYIDSDMYGKQRVSRTDEVKGHFLKNYGYNNYNTVHHEKWEEIQEKGTYVEDYIERLISQNMFKKI